MKNKDVNRIFANNLNSMLDKYELTQAELAEKMKVAPSSVSGWCAGLKFPRMDKVDWICEFFHVTRADMLSESVLPPGCIPLPKTKKVPLVGTIACGTPILAEENISNYVDSPESVHADFCLQCKGDSMINARINDGDFVYIRQQPTVEQGQIAAVLIDDEATLKRVFTYADHIVLQPENTAYEPMILIGERMNDVRILGRAVAFTSYFK